MLARVCERSHDYLKCVLVRVSERLRAGDMAISGNSLRRCESHEFAWDHVATGVSPRDAALACGGIAAARSQVIAGPSGAASALNGPGPLAVAVPRR